VLFNTRQRFGAPKAFGVLCACFQTISGMRPFQESMA
jgi:hypothetical protein